MSARDPWDAVLLLIVATGSPRNSPAETIAAWAAWTMGAVAIVAIGIAAWRDP